MKCKWCASNLHIEDSVLVDKTLGDCCSGDEQGNNENGIHEMDECIHCGQVKDKFSLDSGYQDCEPCSIQDVNNWFDEMETKTPSL